VADKTKAYPENRPGRYFVDENCIACDACVNTAPEFFEMHDKGYSFVRKQPGTAEETALCEEALEGCPTDAIGRDGDT